MIMVSPSTLENSEQIKKFGQNGSWTFKVFSHPLNIYLTQLFLIGTNLDLVCIFTINLKV
jgi:hypothetical protein